MQSLYNTIQQDPLWQLSPLFGHSPVSQPGQLTIDLTSCCMNSAATSTILFWCLPVQVTRKLAVLHVHAHQQGTPEPYRTKIAGVLGAWLHKAHQTLAASPQSHLAACVRQQLQQSGLPQQMSALLTDAADGIAAAAAAVADASAPAADRSTAY